MTETYEDLEARLRTCFEHAGRSVPDEAPKFDSAQRSRRSTHRRRKRAGLGMVGRAAVVAGILAVGLEMPRTATAQSRLIAATDATIAAHTARVSLTSVS